MKVKSVSMLYTTTAPLFLIRSNSALAVVLIRKAFILLLLSISLCAYSQSKRLVAIGSSTTVGYGTTSIDSCWFGRCSRYYKCQLQMMDSSFNLGVPGINVYAGMPTGFQPPANRPGPEEGKNISQAEAILRNLINPADGVIIVNYPTNDYNKFSIPEIMTCLQLIYDSATQSGFHCFITTTQPRADSLFNNFNTKRKLADIKDSIINRFGEAHTLNFWDGMFTAADTTILPVYSAGDQIHFNNEGHRVLFQRILAKNVFSLPVWYARPTGFLNLLTSWGTNKDGSGNHPTSFAADNQLFIVANNLLPTVNGNWSISGKNAQLIIGDGVRPVIFRIPAAYKVSLSSPTVTTCE